MSQGILDDKLMLTGGASSGIGAPARSRARRGARSGAPEIDGSIVVSATVLAQRPANSSKR